MAARSLEVTCNEYEELISTLSIEQDTGILSRNSLWALFDDLGRRNVLEGMKAGGHTCMLTFLDVDSLKSHNQLGGHDGGDGAIHTVASTMRGLFQRENDIVGVLEHRQAAQAALDGLGSFNTLLRMDGGDEMLVISSLPPDRTEGDDQVDKRGQGDGPDEQKRRIMEAFAGLQVTYPLREGITADVLNELRQRGFRFDSVDGQATVPVAITFAIVACTMPTSRNELLANLRVADHEVLVQKCRPTHPGDNATGTVGTVIDLREQERGSVGG
jgi:GGDEF domain-containing protein